MKKWADGIMALTVLAFLVAFVLCGVTWIETQQPAALIWAIVLFLAAMVGVLIANKAGGKR